jgi:hypothetical protein
MLTYFISASNNYTIRVSPVLPANDGTYNFGSLYLQNMTTLENTIVMLDYASYNPYESLFSFTANIEDAIPAAEYRATITGANFADEIWHGSIQVFSSQSVDKANYTNQIPLDDKFVSNVSENKYVILT